MESMSFRHVDRMDRLLAEVRAEVAAQQHMSHNDCKRQLEMQVSELQTMHQRLISLEQTHKAEIQEYQSKLHSYETTIFRLEAELAQRSSPSTTIHSHATTETLPTSRSDTPYETDPNWADTALDLVPSQYKITVQDDWYALFNPHVPRRFNVELRYTIQVENVVCCVCFSPDGRHLAAATHQSVQVFDVQSRLHVADLVENHTRWDSTDESFIRSICFSKDGGYIATASEDSVIRVWDFHHRKLYKRLLGHKDQLFALEYIDDHRLVSGGRDSTVRIWDVHNGVEQFILPTTDSVASVSVSPDSNHVAASCQDGSIHIWHIGTGDRVAKLQGGPDSHTDSIYCVCFLPSGQELVSGSLDGFVKSWQRSSPIASPESMPPPPIPQPSTSVTQKQTWALKSTMQGHTDYVISVGVTSDAQWIISGSKDRSVRIWDAQTGAVQCVMHSHTNTILSIATSSNEQFATGSGDRLIRVWAYSNNYRTSAPPA